jgi:hypothetical protein
VAVQINWRPLGRLLVENGVISEVELEQALSVQAASGKRLGEVLVERGVISGPALTVALAEQWGIEVNAEGGFGSGLWQEIDRRHRLRRTTDAPALHVVEPLDDDEPAAAEPDETATEQPDEAAAEQPVAEQPVEATPDPSDEELTLLRAELEELRAELARRDDALGELGSRYEQAARELEALRAAPAARSTVDAHLLFVQRGERYAIVDGEGAAPPVGADLELEGISLRVWKLGRSPLPGDHRLCAFALPLDPTNAD